MIWPFAVRQIDFWADCHSIFSLQVQFYDIGKQKIRKEFKLSHGVKLQSIASK